MKAEFDAHNLAKELTVTVEIKRYNQWLVRLWIAKQLIKLAGFIAWVDIEFSDDIQRKKDEEFLRKWLDDFEQMIKRSKEHELSDADREEFFKHNSIDLSHLDY